MQENNSQIKRKLGGPFFLILFNYLEIVHICYSGKIVAFIFYSRKIMIFLITNLIAL